MDTVADRIKTIRELRNYTQKYLADKAGIHEVQIQMYEYGTRTPKIAQLQKISEALEVDIAFLQPSRTDTPFAILALLYDLIQQYGDIVLENKGGTVLFGINHFDYSGLNIMLTAAINAHKELSVEDFKKWLINYPPLVHDGEIIEKGTTP